MTGLAAVRINHGLETDLAVAARREKTLASLIAYKTANTSLPPECVGGLYDYVFAGNGVFIHAKRSELEVCFPVEACAIRGLPNLLPVFKFRLPRITECFVRAMVHDANVQAREGKETLFHLCWSDLAVMDNGWVGYEPEQERTSSTCRPLNDGGSHDTAVVEVHSHHSMAARFSPQDNLDETGFRLYGVIGRLPDAPEIRLRVGVYGYFWEIPASWVMDLPDGVRDCVEEAIYV